MNTADNDIEQTLALVARAAADYARPDAQRARRVRDATHGHDPLVWREMARQGWLAVLLPEAQGGTNLGIRAAVVIAERLGYACHTEAFVPVAVVAARCLELCAESEVRNGLLEALGSAAQCVTVAWQSPRGEFSTDAVEVVAERSGDIFSLRGDARFVPAPHADVFVIASRLQGELALFVVAAGTPGLNVALEAMADGTLSGWLHCNGVSVSRGALLATGAAAETALNAAVDAGVLATSAELLGLIDRSLEITRGHLTVRQQFGQAIGAFQVLQHRTVDMWMQVMLTRAALCTALKAFSERSASPQACRVAASSVKARASEAALFVAGQAVQLHGAIGTSDEYELGVYVNRSIVLAAHFGNAAAHRRRYGALVTVEER